VCAPEGVEIEGLLRARTTGGSEAAPERRLGDETSERRSERVRVAWLDQQPSLAVGDLLGHAAHAGCDHREARRHCLQDRDGKALGHARENEHVRGGKQLGNVAALPGEADGAGESQSLDLLLQSRAVWPVADDHGLERVGPEIAESADEGREVLRRLQPADRQDQRPLPLDRSRTRCALHVHRIRDHDRPLPGTSSRRKPRCALALRDADRHGRERLHQSVEPAIEPRREARVRSEGPAMDGKDPDRNASEEAGETTEHAGLRAAGVEDVRSLAPQQARQLIEPGEIAPEADRAADVLQRMEANTRRSGSLAERPGSVRCDRDVEVADERRKQRCDVGLSPADFRQRDDQQQPWSPPVGA
jgi:hypothetical protein